MAKITKQRRMVERLKDPIVVKTQNRKQKTNLNAFKSKFLTLKKKISALQKYKLANNYNYEEECVSEVPENRESNTVNKEASKTASIKSINPPKKAKQNTKKQTFSTRPATPAANYHPKKVFTPGSRFFNNVSDSSDEEEVEPFTKENQLRKGDEHQDICGMETSIDDDEMGLEEM